MWSTSRALTIITPVSIDHQQYLGETLPEIAGEKAGIIKRGVPVCRRPAGRSRACGDRGQGRAAGRSGPGHGQHWRAFEDRGRLVYQDENGLLDLPLPNLPGPHQIRTRGGDCRAAPSWAGMRPRVRLR
jgi:dihydrofolate synthase/folylpolyglutamate synthase